jgi:hypothetical protein
MATLLATGRTDRHRIRRHAEFIDFVLDLLDFMEVKYPWSTG